MDFRSFLRNRSHEQCLLYFSRAMPPNPESFQAQFHPGCTLEFLTTADSDRLPATRPRSLHHQLSNSRIVQGCCQPVSVVGNREIAAREIQPLTNDHEFVMDTRRVDSLSYTH